MDIKEYIESKTIIPRQLEREAEQLQLEDRLITWRKAYLQNTPKITNEEYDTELNRLKIMSTELFPKAYSLKDVVDKLGTKNILKKYYVTEKLEGVTIKIDYDQGNIKSIKTEIGQEVKVENLKGIPIEVNPQIKSVRGILTLKKELNKKLQEELKKNIENSTNLVQYLIETGNTQYLDLFAIDTECNLRLFSQKNKKLEEIGYKPLAYKIVEGNINATLTRLEASIENLNIESDLKEYPTYGYIIRENNGKQAVHYIKESCKNIYRVKVKQINITEKPTELRYNIIVDREIGTSGKNVIENCTLKDIWVMGVVIDKEIYVRQGLERNYLCTELGEIVI